MFCQSQSQSGCHIQVFNYEEGSLHSVIDSHGTRLRRPTGELLLLNLPLHLLPSLPGLCVGDRFAYIVDIAADCVRKFRYK